MTQQQYMSNGIICEYLTDIVVLYDIVELIGNLKRVSALSSVHGITYHYSSTSEESIDALHHAWEEYLNGDM